MGFFLTAQAVAHVPGSRFARWCRRRPPGFLLLLPAVLIIAGAFGCGGDGPTVSNRKGEVLRVGTPMPVRVTNPLVDYSYNIFAMLATHDTLVRFDGAMQPQPQLALDWETSTDARRWRFSLRTDATWHDGRPVTAADVKFTFDYLAAHHGASTWMRTLIDSIQVTGTTVTFHLARPYSRFLINCGFIVRILPRHVWEKVADPFRPGDAPVTMGCGPFIFQRFDPHTGRLAFRRNDAYYGLLPAVAGLEFFVDRPFDTLALSLRRGDLDLYYKYASGFPPTYLSTLAAAPGLRLPGADAMGVPAALGFNGRCRPTDDAAFRKAVVAALDYTRISASMLGDRGRIPDSGFLPPAFVDRQIHPALVHDPGKSRRWLDRGGYTDTDGNGVRNLPGGGDIVLRVLARADLEGTGALLPILSHNLKTVGLSMAIERVDLSTWIERVKGAQYDLVLFRTTPWGMIMDAGVASGYFDSRRRGGGTLANVADPVFHELCDRILATTDPTHQAGMRHAIQRYYAEHLPAVALCWAVNTYPVQRAWQGLIVNQIEGGLINRQTLAAIQPGGSDKPIQ